MECVCLLKLWTLAIVTCIIRAQFPPLPPLPALPAGQGLLGRVDMLRRNMLQNLRSQANMLSQPMLPAIRPNVRSQPVAPPSGARNSMIPVNQLLNQQQDLQSQLLQDVLNRQRTMFNDISNSNRNLTLNSNIYPQQTANVPDKRSNTGNNGRVRVVLLGQPQNNGGIDVTNVGTQQSTVLNTPSTSFGSPFSSSSNGNNSFSNFFSTVEGGGGGGGGDLTFPSTSEAFWTGSVSPDSSAQPTSSSVSSVQNTNTGNTSPFWTGGVTSDSAAQPTNTGNKQTFWSGGVTSDSAAQPTNTGNTQTFWSGGVISDSASQPPSPSVTVIQNTNTGNTQSLGSTSKTIDPTPPALICTEEYQREAGHTLCKTDSPWLTGGGLSVEDKLMVTKLHNDLRATVEPPAEDLVVLQWDEKLAAVARKWARQCTLGHDDERTVLGMGLSVGQNVAVGYETWQQAIQEWYNEIRMYRYGWDPDSYLGPDGWRKVAHFTQIVQNTTYLIGCGYAECDRTEYVRYYVCNYAAGQSELAFPYTAGSRCGRCPNNCNNGLCDCGNVVCYNKGELDPSTCTCKCSKPYAGVNCEIVDCPPEDRWICGRDWPQSYCDSFYNVPQECPHMCGLCSGGGIKPTKPTTPAINETYTSSFGCVYTGKRDDAARCAAYGNNGADMTMCASEGGNVGCDQCQMYFNIKRDYCPVMCGLCDPPCNGKKCLNGGTLDTNTCTCSCRTPFAGDVCELAQCPVKGDPGFCRFWPVGYCRLYYNVPEECPYMCGICKDTTPKAAQ